MLPVPEEQELALEQLPAVSVARFVESTALMALASTRLAKVLARHRPNQKTHLLSVAQEMPTRGKRLLALLKIPID